MDSQLLKKARAGNEAAFEQLMRPMESLIWRVCWHYLGQREAAEDCAQETMLRVWRGLSGYREDSTFESWVYRIAANQCLDLLRKQKREKSVPLEPLREQGFDPPDAGPGTEIRVLAREEQRRLREALAGLPEEQRDALVLTQLEGWSYERTAGVLGVTEGTVKSRVSRGKERLKELLGLDRALPEQSAASRELSAAKVVQKNRRGRKEARP